MKKTSLMALALLISITSGANAAWWDDANSEYNKLSSNSQVYTQEDEDLALQMAIAASLHDMDTVDSSAIQDVWMDANSRTNNVYKANKVGAQTWMHNTFDEGPNTGYALVRTQRQLKEEYNPIEEKLGSYQAQSQLMADGNLSEDDLLAYVLQLSLLDR